MYSAAPQRNASNQIWLAFRWGDNHLTDTSYLYRANIGSWQFWHGDMSRTAQLFGDGSPPAAVGIDASDFAVIELP